ncbi:hypothetical protein GF325_00230 [Candidatus Bathyarchaeota archaeon]|nr:hypothetical protein [Candidatus Bathyarchaeota archaeon]
MASMDEITPILDEFTRAYARLTGRGGMRGILLIDQDAKVIAKNSMFCLKKPWDMGGIGAALYGVSKQASLYFNSAGMERISIVFDNLKFFVKCIGKVPLDDGKPSREVLFVILSEKHVKEGLVIIQMRKFAPKILEAIHKSSGTTKLLGLDERSVKSYLLGLGA